jgi:SAM-dependent methyltransferase
MDSPATDFRLKWTFGLSIFLSAFLLFQIEPIIAKIILPWFGGAAAVWSVCLLFFQVTLLLGYLYAHLLTRHVPGRFRGWIHIPLLVASLLVLPVIPSGAWKPTGSEDPTFRVLLLLALTIGLPYFLLASTSPLLQAWYSKSTDDASTYRLYALSNIGSMLGLLSYPLLIEPLISTRHQAINWSIGYGVFVFLCAYLAFRHHKASDPPNPLPFVPPTPLPTRLLWVGLAACGSTLLLAVTNHITQNIASVPFLWIAPLVLYLLSFILCFADRGWYRRTIYLRFLGVALGVMTYALAPEFINIPLYVLLPVFCIGLFLCCMVLHGELAQLKPHSSELTLFYLLVSLGGAVGALFVALLAPRIFSGFYELPIALGACAVFVLWTLHHAPDDDPNWKRTWLVLVAITVVLVVGLYRNTFVRPVMPRLMARNFYGALRVVDAGNFSTAMVEGVPALSPHDPYAYRTLMNGSIDHGSQFLSPDRRREATTYYSEKSGVGIALKAAAHQGPLHVGVIGLGAGTIASYANASDNYVFYEINPNVISIADSQFSYLQDARARGAQIDTVLGDARLSLERQQPQQFDLLAVDAFSSDSIPVHLLTREAFDLYVRHLKHGGTLAVHVSNRYLNLQPVVTRAATAMGREVLMVANEPDQPKGVSRSTWILVCDRGGLLEQEGVRPTGTLLKSSIPRPLWTDDYSSLLPLLK